MGVVGEAMLPTPVTSCLPLKSDLDQKGMPVATEGAFCSPYQKYSIVSNIVIKELISFYPEMWLNTLCNLQMHLCNIVPSFIGYP